MHFEDPAGKHVQITPGCKILFRMADHTVGFQGLNGALFKFSANGKNIPLLTPQHKIHVFFVMTLIATLLGRSFKSLTGTTTASFEVTEVQGKKGDMANPRVFFDKSDAVSYFRRGSDLNPVDFGNGCRSLNLLGQHLDVDFDRVALLIATVLNLRATPHPRSYTGIKLYELVTP